MSMHPSPSSSSARLALWTLAAAAVLIVSYLLVRDDGSGSPILDRFALTIAADDFTIQLEGASEFTATPSSFSIQMAADQGRCVLHLLNFTTPPGPGTYDVEHRDEIRTAMVCLLEGVEPQERLASTAGTFTLEQIDAKGLRGRLEMTLVGPLSGRTYSVSGTLEAVNAPLDLVF